MSRLDRDELDQRLEKDPRVRDSRYMSWIAKLPCAACMVKGVYNTRVHVCHLRSGSLEHGKRSTGMQEKSSDRWCLPGCPHHHVNGGKESQHHYPGGEVAFWNDKGICPFDLSLALQAAYAEKRSGAAVIAEFAAKGRRA